MCAQNAGVLLNSDPAEQHENTTSPRLSSPFLSFSCIFVEDT